MTAHAAHIAVRGRAPRRSSPPAPALPARSRARAAGERAGCAEAARLGALPRHFLPKNGKKPPNRRKTGAKSALTNYLQLFLKNFVNATQNSLTEIL